VASPAALRARPAWETDPSFLAEYERQYPYQQAADAILQLRADLGLTQQELASRAGTTQSVVARAESGRHSFQISLLNRVAAAGGIIVLANVVRSSEPAYLMTPPADPGDNSFSELALTANCSG
jgi:transcriptional regulator with XRE-family HTH domain